MVGWFFALLASAFSQSFSDIVNQGWQPPRHYPIQAYSEFTPAPLLGVRPFETRLDTPQTLFHGEAFRNFKGRHFLVSPLEEKKIIQPDLESLSEKWLSTLSEKEPVVALLPLTLSKTKDDKGMTPWTLFGGADEDPEAAFFRALGKTDPVQFFCGLFKKVYGLATCRTADDLNTADVGILSNNPPKALGILRYSGKNLKYLITFEPRHTWHKKLQEAFLAGKLQVIPHPKTLEGYHHSYLKTLSQTNAEAWQIPFGKVVSDLSPFSRLRFLEVKPMTLISPEVPGPFRKVFEASPEVMELYGKPTARNVQIWGTSGKFEGRWILNGPTSWKAEIDLARGIIQNETKSTFAFREYFPPMEINGFQVRWIRPFIAYWDPSKKKSEVDFSVTGFASFKKGQERIELPVSISDGLGLEEEWIAAFDEIEGAYNLQKVFEFSRLLGKRLPLATVNVLLTERDSLANWLDSIKKDLPKTARKLDSYVDTNSRVKLPFPLTFDRTVGDRFEKRYWDKLVDLSQGYRNKNNLDCLREGLQENCKENELPVLAENYLKAFYRSLGLEVRYHVFPWRTDFDWVLDFDKARPWTFGMGLNLPSLPYSEVLKHGHKNIVAVIPGENHDEAVILADHYDTAYMEDVFNKSGLRLAAPGADDNHSGTATLMEAAIALKNLRLKRDVWLVHLTGEEFPADSLGGRALAESLVTGNGVIRGKENPKVVGIFVLDMIAHNTDRDKDPKAPSIFQIAYGRGERAARLALTAHAVTLSWNFRAGEDGNSGWNRDLGRKEIGERISLVPGKPVPRPKAALFPRFRGELRPAWHPKSSLYNTDAVIFSESGLPVVLFMENYDIERKGYHDSKDTLDNIDLDFGAGLSRIAIETVAQVAGTP